MGITLEDFLKQKGAEYAPFDPSRAKRIFLLLRDKIKLQAYKIHIIGTNGKGSSGRYLALGLMQNQKSVLHFTSPHLFSFNERYYKNGANIEWADLEQAHQFLQAIEGVSEASYFEYATFLAFVLAQDVEYLILEAGLGGEYDSTSCIESDLSIFTLIGIDHQEFLGNTLEEIAITKLNAMQKNAIIAKQKSAIVNQVAQKIALEKSVKLIEINEKMEENFTDVLKTCPSGFLKDNFLNALVAMQFLGLKTPERCYALDLRGRFEKVGENVMIDVGHNQDAALRIAEVLGNKKVVLVYNSYKEKDIAKILTILKNNIIRIEILDVENPRIVDRDRLETIISGLGIEFCCFREIDLKETYLVFGSFSVVEAFLKGSYV